MPMLPLFSMPMPPLFSTPMSPLFRGNMGILNRGRGHNNSLADGVDKAILVQVLREALKGQRAEALGGLDSIAKGRGQGAERDTLVDMGGGGSKGAGKDGRQDKGLH